MAVYLKFPPNFRPKFGPKLFSNFGPNLVHKGSPIYNSGLNNTFWTAEALSKCLFFV